MMYGARSFSSYPPVSNMLIDQEWCPPLPNTFCSWCGQPGSTSQPSTSSPGTTTRQFNHYLLYTIFMFDSLDCRTGIRSKIFPSKVSSYVHSSHSHYEKSSTMREVVQEPIRSESLLSSSTESSPSSSLKSSPESLPSSSPELKVRKFKVKNLKF